MDKLVRLIRSAIMEAWPVIPGMINKDVDTRSFTVTHRGIRYTVTVKQEND